MKCLKCQIENPEAKKFCRECGAKLAVACPQCSAEIFPGDKFCGECGHNLALPSGSISPKEPSFDEKLDKIQRYLPEGLTEKILSQRDKIEGERRQVTIMFCDIKGFTPLTEMLGPEETFSLMDQVYEILIQKVHDYEGTVNELRGDGILALFGAPIALEDAPQRAIRSALAIHREMARFNERIKGIYSIPPILLRIGINTGPVVVGAVGNNLRVQFTAAGDTINMASRMEGLAGPGTTYVTEDTFKLTEGFFRFEALGKKEVKGKNEPLSVYRVIAPRTSRTRFDVSSERGLTTFVGREREVELLLDAFERAKAGRGQAISVVSEAGVGKSRLLYEFRKAVTNEDVTFLEGKCLSYSRSIAYHPVIDILKANFDVMENDGDEEIREKVESGLKTLGLDNVSTFPYILELLSVEHSGIDTIPISPEARKDRIMEALKQIVLKGSEIRALILAYEDLHWADKSSEDVLKYILESIPASRVLLLFTYRPEFVHSWGGKSFHSQITLNKLSNRESLTMIYHLLGTHAVESHLEELILEKAEGIPFFVEEFIRSLKDLKIIDIKDGKYALTKDIRELTIPSTIQDVIMARIDALPESAKEVLQIGSVIEREFSYELMKNVAGLPEQELLSQLSVLRDSELLYERGIYPETTYIFKHALTREVVYESMLSQRKRRLHEQVANAIIELFKDRVEEYYGMLAEHFIASEIYEKGAEYSNLAGKKARKAALFLDAIEHGKKRLRCLQKFLPTDETHHKIIDTRTFLASCYLSLNRFFEAKKAVNPIFDLAVQLDYKRRLPQIYTIMGTSCYWVDEDFPLAFEYLINALTLSEQTGNFGAQWFSNYFLGTTLSGSCEFERALGYFGKALDMSVAAKNLTTESFTKGAMTAFNYNYQGKIDLAYQTSSEALDLAEQTGDIYVEGMAYTSHGIPCYHKGLFDKAESCLLKGLELCQKTTQVAWAAWASFWLAELYVNRGDYENAENYYRKAISIFTEHGKVFASWVRMFEVCIERSKILNGQRKLDLNKLLSCYDGIKMKILEGFMARYIGEILLKMGGGYLSNAEDWIEKAMEADKRNGAIWLLGCDCELYAEFLRHKEDLIGVRENLNKALVTFKECGAEGHLKRVEGKLAALH
jgi:class 3 adenylate cyclase/tetratricopeptide (TPR) repeat protein